MIWTVSLLLCGAFLLGIGCLFVWVDFRATFGPSFTYFARQLVVISLASIEDQLEVLPDLKPEVVLWLHWAVHFLSVLFLLNTAVFMKQSGWRVGPKIFLGFCIASILIVVLIPLPEFFTLTSTGLVIAGPWYLPTFPPFVCITMSVFLVFLVYQARTAPPGIRSQAWIHLFVTSFALFAALINVVEMFRPKDFLAFSDRVIPLATLGFGAMCAKFFAAEFFKTFRERQELFERLGALSQDLDRLQPLGQLGENAAFISHEIKNYVGVLKANNLLLQSKFAGSAEGGEMERITRSTDRLEQFTRSILDFSLASKAVQLKEMDLSEFIREMAGMLRKSSLVNISIEAEGPCVLLGDRLRLEQMMNNLFKNSLEAGARHIRIRLSAQPQFWVLEFQDDGCGCSAADLEQLAKPFFTTKRHQGGSGLGLALVASIVNSHGGSMAFAHASEAQPDATRGLLIRCRFPAVAGK